MSTKAEQYRESKSSNEQSFEALNEVNEKASHGEHTSRPSQNSDFDQINDKRYSEEQIHQKDEQNLPHFGQQLKTLEKIIIENQKSVEEQLQILKFQYGQKEKEISLLQAQNINLKKKCHDFEQNARFYKGQYEKLQQKIKQQLDVSCSTAKVSEMVRVQQISPSKDFSKKKSSTALNTLQEELKENLRESQFKCHSLHTKLQFFIEQDRKIRQFLSKSLKFNPTFTMQLSTLVQSAVISLDTNLKQLNREIENIILNCHLANSNKIVAKREKLEEQKYNHWQTLGYLDTVKGYLEDCYKNK